ncbi:MAG: hypothetical protein ACRDGV_01025 [Candidatus Limnocylindria bacterium]
MRRSALAALLAGATLLAACAETASSPSPTDEPTPEPTATPTPEPTEEAIPTEAALPTFDLPSSAAELEALLPDEIGGVPMEKFSMRGAELMAGGGGDADQEFIDFLNRVGAQPDDVSAAFAFGISEDFTSSATVVAFRVEGVPEDRLAAEMQAAFEADETATDFTPANVGGKDVLVGQTDEELAPLAYLYSVGDIVFFLGTSNEADAAEVLSGLP